jgi:indolepyruvate ferredoxin oxidoreductase alpha subunit
MTREAFDLSERFHVPVLLRLVTRLAHSRAVVHVREARGENPIRKAAVASSWILLPAHARRQWHDLLERQPAFGEWSESASYNHLRLNPERRDLGVITTGIARNYYLENLAELGEPPSHLHVGAYPAPDELVRRLVGHVNKVLVLEEGYPFLERRLRGIVQPAVEIAGKESGDVPPDGELTPDIVRRALGLRERPGVEVPGLSLPSRPPQLCSGCPHADSFDAIKAALAGFGASAVAADIGCYTLGALPPYSAIESCVCMGASVGMAKGASDAGLRPAIAIIGDSTFMHSGVTPLMDAVAHDTDMTLIILDNETTAMTGGQPTILPSSRLQPLVLGLGVKPEHCLVLETHRRQVAENTAAIRRELEHPGLSVVIIVRECIETLKTKKKA